MMSSLALHTRADCMDLDQPGSDATPELGSYAWSLARHIAATARLEDNTPPAPNIPSPRSDAIQTLQVLQDTFDPIGALRRWILIRPDIIIHASTIFGGWERSAQIDVYLMLISQHVETHCEEHCFEDSSPRCDFTLHQTVPSPCSDSVVEMWHFVELKCRGRNEEVRSFYRNKLRTDINKLVTNRPYHKYMTGEVHLWAIGLLNIKELKWAYPYNGRLSSVQILDDISKKVPHVIDLHGQKRALHHHLLSNDFIVSWWTENFADVPECPPAKPDGTYTYACRRIDHAGPIIRQVTFPHLSDEDSTERRADLEPRGLKIVGQYYHAIDPWKRG